MHRLQEMIRLHRLGRSQREIARQLRMGRDTIRTFFDIVSEAGLLEGLPEDLPNAEILRQLLAAQLPAVEPPQQTSSLERWRPKIMELLKRGATPTPIHDFLRLHEPEYQGSVSAVKRLCARIRRDAGPTEADVAIPVETSAGEVAQVDFGYAGMRYDPGHGVLRRSWVFVMTLAHSRHMYHGLVFDQKITTWLALHVGAFEFFGGVPRVIVPDNLKSAVVRAAFGVDDDPALNRSYRELARHYGFQVDPTPPRSPQKKGKVERDVRYVKHNFFATWESVDIHEDLRQLRRWNLEVAARRKHGTTGRAPIEVFEQEKRSALLPLPKKPWEPVVWKKARLHRDCHVQVDGAFYSAPWRFLGEELWVRSTAHCVAIHRDDELLWTHARIGRGQRRTVETHLPDHRRDLRHRSKEFWVERAREIGADVESLVLRIFASDDVLLKLRCVQAVVRHLETFPKRRAQRAAARSLHFGCIDYGSIKKILSKGLDLDPLPGEVTRSWSQGARYARKPTVPTLISAKERGNGTRG